MFFLILSVPGSFILFIVISFICVKRRNKNLKEKLWDSAGYKVTKQISTLYIDENKKSWYVIGCSQVYKYSDIKYSQIVKHSIKRGTVHHTSKRYTRLQGMNFPHRRFVS